MAYWYTGSAFHQIPQSYHIYLIIIIGIFSPKLKFWKFQLIICSTDRVILLISEIYSLQGWNLILWQRKSFKTKKKCIFLQFLIRFMACLELRQPEVVYQCYSSVTTSRDPDIILMGIVSSYGACFLLIMSQLMYNHVTRVGFIKLLGNGPTGPVLTH